MRLFSLSEISDGMISRFCFFSESIKSGCRACIQLNDCLLRKTGFMAPVSIASKALALRKSRRPKNSSESFNN